MESRKKGKRKDMNQFSEADVIVNVVFLALAMLFLGLRFISCVHIAHRVTRSDYAMLIGWVLVCALSVANIYSTTKGLGLREGVLKSWRNPLARAEYAFAVLYVCPFDLSAMLSAYPTRSIQYPALAAIKVSILLFYLTLAKEELLFRLGIYITLGVVLLSTTALTLVNLFPCRPLSASFQITTPPGTYCIDIVALYISTSPINIVTEVAIFFLPMPILLGMRLPRRQKAILLFTFGTGLFVIVISVLRIEFLLQAAVHRVTKYQPPSVHDLSCRQHFTAFLFRLLHLYLLTHRHRL
jgi:hypothetical protein